MSNRNWNIKPDLKTINGRIVAIVQHSGMMAAHFSREVGLSHTTMNLIYDGREVSKTTENKILGRFKEISTEWLRDGKGPMLKDLKEPEMEQPQEEPRTLRTAPIEATTIEHSMPVSAIIQLTQAKTEARMYKEWHERDARAHETIMNEHFKKLDTSLNHIVEILSVMAEKDCDKTPTSPQNAHPEGHQRAQTDIRQAPRGKPTAP
jgi:hypothetical protein